MKSTLLRIASAAEAATGVVLAAYPPIVVRLLFDSEIAGAGIPMCRIAGLALIALGMACWPRSSVVERESTAIAAMLFYSLLSALYLVYLGIGGQWVGLLLWPAVTIHGVLTILLARLLSSVRQAQGVHRRQ